MLIQKLRLQRGWSQQQLADLSGLSIRTIQRAERGQSPSTETLKSLASVFEIDFSELTEESAMSSGSSINTSTDEKLALRQVRQLRRFYVHVLQYVFVIGTLLAVNLVATPHRFWVGWPAFGWGLGLLAHAANVFELIPFLAADWEKRQIEKRLGRPL